MIFDRVDESHEADTDPRSPQPGGRGSFNPGDTSVVVTVRVKTLAHPICSCGARWWAGEPLEGAVLMCGASFTGQSSLLWFFDLVTELLCGRIAG